VDESETGSANFFGPSSIVVSGLHLRPPSIDPGVTSFLWAFALALFVWAGLLAVGVSQGTALVLALLSFGAIFLFVRLRGEDELG
jgi:hypothetical protein